MNPVVFLGGTVGGSTWREEFARRLAALGFRAHDPTVADWTAERQADEDEVKRAASICLYYICDLSCYSLVEATMGLYDRGESTVVVFALDGLEGHALRSLMKCEQDLRERFPEGHIFARPDEALAYFARVGPGVRVREAGE